jgi:hypothetical protein
MEISDLSVSCYTTVTEKIATSSAFVIIPSTFQPGVLKTFDLCVYSDNQVTLKQLSDHELAVQPPETQENDGQHTKEKAKEKKSKKKKQEDSKKQTD